MKLQLTKYSGTGSVLGKDRTIEYDAGKLSISNLTTAEVEAVLNALGGTKEATTAPAPAPTQANGAAGKPTPTAAKPAGAPATRAAGATPPPTTATPRTAAAPAKPKAAPPPPPPADDDDEEDEEDAATADDDDDDGEDGAAAADIEVPEETMAVLVKATRIRDVLQPLIELGINTTPALVAKCEQLKAEVPVLGRIPDLADRVTRAAEVLDLGGQA